jgi:hypothetical protein
MNRHACYNFSIRIAQLLLDVACMRACVAAFVVDTMIHVSADLHVAQPPCVWGENSNVVYKSSSRRGRGMSKPSLRGAPRPSLVTKSPSARGA